MNEPAGAWWRSRRPGSYRVFSMDVQSAAFIGWNIIFDKMRLIRWSPADGLSDVTRPRLS